MSEGRKEPLTHAGLIAHKLAIEARADVIGEQSSEDAASLQTLLALLHYEIASNHVVQQLAAAKVHEFFDFARPEPADAGPHAVGWRCTVEGARIGNLSLRAQDRVLRAVLALQRLYALIGGGNGGGTWTWARPDWLDAFPEMTPENLAKANAAQKAADERRRREAEGEQPKLHAMPGQRRGQLKNGNPAGDYLASPRCGARTRSGTCCRQPAMANGRCRMHGGLSTGARTAEGQARARSARFVHGCRTAEIIDFRAAAARSARRLATLTRLAREANAPAGHGVHRSVSSSSLSKESIAGTKPTGRSAFARVLRVFLASQFKPLQSSAPRSPRLRVKDYLRASAFIRGFKPSTPPAAAGHGVHRSVSSPPLHRLAGTRRQAI
jgi:hypothetical protein